MLRARTCQVMGREVVAVCGSPPLSPWLQGWEPSRSVTPCSRCPPAPPPSSATHAYYRLQVVFATEGPIGMALIPASVPPKLASPDGHAQQASCSVCNVLHHEHRGVQAGLRSDDIVVAVDSEVLGLTQGLLVVVDSQALGATVQRTAGSPRRARLSWSCVPQSMLNSSAEVLRQQLAAGKR